MNTMISADTNTAPMVEIEEQIEDRSGEVTFLLPEQLSHGDGIGPTLELGDNRGKLLVATLGIDHVVEHGGLIVSIWGSPDGMEWGNKPLVSFPQKYYCGFYSALLNLAPHPEIRYLRPRWSMKAWGKKSSVPLFSFHLFLEESGARLAQATA